MSEASAGALDPWIPLRLLNLTAGVWHVQICVQQVGQPSQKISGQILARGRLRPLDPSRQGPQHQVQEVSEDTDGI